MLGRKLVALEILPHNKLGCGCRTCRQTPQSLPPKAFWQHILYHQRFVGIEKGETKCAPKSRSKLDIWHHTPWHDMHTIAVIDLAPKEPTDKLALKISLQTRSRRRPLETPTTCLLNMEFTSTYSKFTLARSRWSSTCGRDQFPPQKKSITKPRIWLKLGQAAWVDLAKLY